MPSQLEMFPKAKFRRRSPEPMEQETHRELAKTLRRWSNPGWLSNHFPAGELRPKATAGKLKGMGLVPGWADFILIDPRGQHYWLELKRGGAPLNDAQVIFRDQMWERGVPYEVARSLGEALEILARWGAIRVKVSA